MTQKEQIEAMKPVVELLDNAPQGKRIKSNWKAPEGFSLEKFRVKEVPVEHLIPEKKNGKVILHMHGGGYCIALMDIYRDVAVRYSNMSGGAEVFSLDYRVAPAYEPPAALEDAFAVYTYLLEQGYRADDILFVGDSAGGNLVLVTALYIRDHKMSLPKGIIAISPWGDAGATLPSREENRFKDIFIGEKGTKIYSEVYDSIYFRNADKKNPYMSPVYGDYTGIPSLLIQTGSLEVLRDDSLLIAKAAKEAGVDVTQTTYEDVSHVFQLVIPQMDQSKEALAQMKAFMEKCFA